jgi:MFS family permease
MYSQHELDDAVVAGALSPQAADALRAHIERQRSTVIPDEEQFRLLTGFNDIFVSVAAAILLFALAWIGHRIGAAMGLDMEGEGPSFLGPLAVAGASWALALFFTARRRMALPSIVLLLGFVGGTLAASAMILAQIVGDDQLNNNAQLGGVLGAFAAAIAAGAAWLHWRRFRVPITIAAGAAAAAGIVLGIVLGIVGDAGESTRTIFLSLVLLLGIGVFLFAMWWDGSDRERLTRRSDVAFWLHLLAAPMIVHPVFTLLGLTDGNATIAEGAVVVLLYVALGVTAVAIDRRALLVSALAYVLWAMSDLLKRFGAVELNVALTALVIGSALLLLSAFWHQARSAIVRPLPEGLRDRLPVLGRSAPLAASQPAA